MAYNFGALYVTLTYFPKNTLIIEIHNDLLMKTFTTNLFQLI